MVGAVPPVADDDAEVVVARIEGGIEEEDGVAVGAVVKAGVGGGDSGG
jgi:hypothetical protein